MGGNAFHTAPKPSREGFRRNGAIKWSNPRSVFSVYFHVDQPADLLLKINASGSDGRSILRARIGEESFEVAIEDSVKRVYDVGRIRLRLVTFESTCRALIGRVEHSPTHTYVVFIRSWKASRLSMDISDDKPATVTCGFVM